MIFRFTLSNDGRPAVNPNVGALNTAQQDGDGVIWTLESSPDRWEVVMPGFQFSKKLLFQIVEPVANADYSVGYDFNVTAASSITIRLWDKDFFQNVFSTVNMLSSGDHSGARVLTPGFEPKYLSFEGFGGASGATSSVRQFTFSATNTPEAIPSASQIISEPDGWKDTVLKLERHEDFHSLIEFFEGAFIFYGTNGVEDGGIDFIKLKEQQFGPDATINILIEIAIDDINFESLFTGQLDLSSKEELDDNTIQLGIIREDFWAKFINRLDTPVNLQDVKNVDGLPARFYDSVNLKMLSQKLLVNTHLTQENYSLYCPVYDASFTSPDFQRCVDTNEYLQVDWDDVIISEVTEKFNLPKSPNPELPVELIYFEYSGEYTISFKFGLTFMEYRSAGPSIPAHYHNMNTICNAFIQINDETPVQADAFHFGTNPVEWTEYSHSVTRFFNKGDTVRIYVQGPASGTFGFGNNTVTIVIAQPVFLGADNSGIEWSGGIGPVDFDQSVESFLRITGNTIHPETNAEGFLIHDAGAHITDRTIGQEGTFYSEFLGSTQTMARQYVSDGCGWFYSLIKGLQLRLYSLLEKPFFMSFKQWWEGANPILNLGLGYEIITLDLNPTVDSFANATQDGSGEDWGIEPTPLRWEVTLTSLQESKLLLFEIFEGIEGAGYEIGYNFNVTEASTLTIRLYDANLIDSVFSNVTMLSSGDHSGTRTLTPDFTPKYVAFYMLAPLAGCVAGVKPFTFNVINIPSQTFQVIRVEEKAHFYDDSETSVDFSNVKRIMKGYDVDNQFNLVEIGYKKWNADDVSGIDDPQTKRNYATIFKKIGKKLSLLSDWIAAGLTIEVTRRTTREKSADYQYDNDVFIVSINPVPVEISPETSPDVIDYEPEQDENFSSVSNLENADTRYNLRLTPARNLLRWMNFISGCLQSYLNSVFKFSSGEGNFDMISQMTDTSPECSEADFKGNFLSEKQDINIQGDYLFLPEPLEITEMPMEYEEYKSIVANRKKPIGISQTSEGHVKCFIKSLEYKIVSGVADLVVWPKTPLELQVVESLPDVGCLPISEPPDEDCVLLTEDGENMLSEANTLLLIENC